MGLETGVVDIADLDETWPLATDDRPEGDDHLRNIKIALKSLLAVGGLAQLGGIFKDRGDPAAFDKTLTGFTTDNAYHDWDLSAIVPAGAVAILLRVNARTSSAGSGTLFFRKNGNSKSFAVSELLCSEVGIQQNEDVVVACDSGRVIEYCATATPTWDVMNAVVKGWWF
jgi:hypothetical protein